MIIAYDFTVENCYNEHIIHGRQFPKLMVHTMNDISIEKSGQFIACIHSKVFKAKSPISREVNITKIEDRCTHY